MTEPTRPLTGAEYVESLRDDREIYLYGERVKDVAEHPAFRNPVRMTARLYDALHDPAHQEVLTTATDDRSEFFDHLTSRNSVREISRRSDNQRYLAVTASAKDHNAGFDSRQKGV